MKMNTKEMMELIGRLESDLAKLREIASQLEPPPKKVTRRDQIEKLVAKAKEQGKNRSWVVGRCETELGMNRHLAFSHLTKIWPSDRNKLHKKISSPYLAAGTARLRRASDLLKQKNKEAS